MNLDEGWLRKSAEPLPGITLTFLKLSRGEGTSLVASRGERSGSIFNTVRRRAEKFACLA